MTSDRERPQGIPGEGAVPPTSQPSTGLDDRDLELLGSMRERQEQWRQIFDATSDALFLYDAATGAIIDVNQTMLEMYGCTHEEALAMSASDLSDGRPPFTEDDARRHVRQALDEGHHVFEWLTKRANGERFWVEVALRSAVISRLDRLIASVRDISKRKRVEAAIRYRSDFENLIAAMSARFINVPVGGVDHLIEVALGEIANFVGADAGYVFRFDEDGTLFRLTHRWQSERLPVDKAELQALPVAAMPWWMSRIRRGEPVVVPNVADLPAEAAYEKQIIESQGVASLVDVPMSSQGEVIGLLGFDSIEPGRDWSDDEVRLLSMVGQMVTNALLRKRAEADKTLLEEQFRHAQKMEAVGRLAGGVAHDFNNLLTGIIGYSEMLLDDLAPDEPMAQDLREIKSAGERAARLTSQLLAFSRKQLIEPRVIDLNETVAQSRRMLARIIGEDIELRFEPRSEVGHILADPDQIDQILVNLATNACDAMPNGGLLTLETADVVLDEAYVQVHTAASVGAFVVLAVSDVGEGMDAETLRRSFEPFFTTKEVGKGTGLGLSTVYGIAKQNGGFVMVDSEPGVGTSVRVYFSQARRDQQAGSHEGDFEQLPHGTETILLVEDEALVRRLARRALEERGYTVLEASDGVSALEIARQGPPVDLLLTDVVMPKLNGLELSRRLRATQPTIRVLYLSGHAEDVIAVRGVFESDAHFVRKPFSIKTLLQRVRQALDGGTSPDAPR